MTKCHPPDSIHRLADVTKITIKRCIDPKTTPGDTAAGPSALCDLLLATHSEDSLRFMFWDKEYTEQITC